MKVELNDIIANLKAQFVILEREYVDQCAVDYMSRKATYLDGQCAMLFKTIEELEDINSDACVEELANSMFEDEEDNLIDSMAQDIEEMGYNPYSGCYDMDL